MTRHLIPSAARSVSQPGAARVRLAIEADLPRVGAIWYESQRADEPSTRPAAPHVPSLYVHELENRELYVLEGGGTVLGFGALITRGAFCFLADLFIARADRSSGHGQHLLTHLLARHRGTCSTISSSDSRALALYVRAGMRPTWPHLALLADMTALRPLPNDHMDVVPADADDPELARWDAEISGRSRLQDQRYWVRHRGGIPLWFRQRGEVVGYGYVQTRSDDLLAHPDALTLGPIGAHTPERAEACTYAAVDWVRGRAAVARIALTGPHPALGLLLGAGFRIGEVETFCSTDGAPLVNVQRYLPSGGDLF